VVEDLLLIWTATEAEDWHIGTGLCQRPQCPRFSAKASTSAARSRRDFRSP
jgi:hypothetical protein